jgi:tRNA threonylcarbamoyladenosine biosynthesis protein TsaB
VIVLGFDTATADTAVAAVDDGEPLFEASLGPGSAGRPRHATRLLPEVDRAVAAAGGWETVELLAVGVGPGSFTGLRIGIATARALAQALELPIAGVGTLAGLARTISEAHPGRSCLPLLDARRGELFAALHDRDGTEIWGPLVATPEALARRVSELQESPLAAGDGALRFRAELHGCGVEIPNDEDPVHRIAARHICRLGIRSGSDEAAAIAPIYLRPPDAERWHERHKR